MQRELLAVIAASTAIATGLASAALLAAPMKPLVIGGEDVTAETFSWQVALVATDKTPGRGVGELMCGGVMISRNHILTAAHCVDQNGDSKRLSLAENLYEEQAINIKIGATRYASATEGELVTVAKITPHPNWKDTANRVDYDLAVITLARPATKGRPVPISRNTVDASIGKAWVSGWGLTEQQKLSPKLRGVAIPIVNADQCVTDNNYGESLTNRMLCAGLREGGKDSCGGDSGGPLVVGSLAQIQLIGIVSWGDGCARPNNYGVYARLSQELLWISRASEGTAQFTSQPPQTLFTIAIKPGHI